jgi:concanavalin A-like lectin/glucanase superfamily protein
MTQAIWVILGVLAVPVVLLLATTGCALDTEGIPSESIGKTRPPGLPYKDTVLDTASLVGYWRLGEKNAVLTTPEPKAENAFWPGNLDGGYMNPAGTTLEEEGALPNDPNTAAQFAGGFVDVPSMPNGDLTPLTGGEVTVELWAKLPDLPNPVPDWALLVGCYEPPDDTMAKGYRLRVRTVTDQNDMIEIEANIGGMPAAFTQQVPLDTGWHHVVLTYPNALGHAELYVDGQASKSPTPGPFDLVTTQSLRFAGGYSVEIGIVTDPYSGWLDEVALYLNYLDPAEVNNHYNAAPNAAQGS